MRVETKDGGKSSALAQSITVSSGDCVFVLGLGSSCSEKDRESEGMEGKEGKKKRKTGTFATMPKVRTQSVTPKKKNTSEARI